MSVLAWIVLGFLAGLLAEKATGRKSGGCITRVAIGVLGAVLGGAVANALGSEGVNDFSLWSLLVAFAGASALLIIFGAVSKR
jgi:uncharacterized membrane protein YeaQ/YmgE (transglycosylase-associated protein family)